MEEELTTLQKIILYPMLGVVTAAMVLGALVVLGSGFDGITRHYGERDVCRTQAETPAEYHACR